MDSQNLPMAFIKKVHAVMKSLFYVHAKLHCCYDTRYDSYVTPDKAGLVLDILNGADDPLAMESVSIAMDKARILHEVQGTQIVIEFERNRGLTFATESAIMNSSI